MWRHIAPAFRLMIALTILCGFIYPAIITGLCHAFFPQRADGSLVVLNGKLIGSELIGQEFAGASYFHSRPSAAGVNGYDPVDSGGSNLGLTSQKLYDRIKKSVERFRRENPAYHGPVPVDLVTASASGLDPDISPASAEAQAARVARARGEPIERVRRLIREHIERRPLGFLGEPRVNVLDLNLVLNRDFPQH